MRNVGVVIVGVTNNIFWEALGGALDKEPELYAYQTCELSSVDRLLRSWHPQVLIIEVSQEGPTIDYKPYIDQYPELIVIGIDTDCADIMVHMQNIGLNLIVQLIHTLVQEQDGAAGYDHQRLHLVRPDDIEKFVTDLSSQEVIEHRSNSQYQSQEQHIYIALKWIDLCLYQRLAWEAKTDDSISVPTWAMTADRARALLSQEFTNKTETELLIMREHLEVTVFNRDTISRYSDNNWKFLNICKAFSLSEKDCQVLLMVLAPELDGRYARVYGFLNDDLTRRRPTATLLAQIVMGGDCSVWDIRKKLTNDQALGRHRLVFLDPSDPLPGSETALVPAPELTAFLLSEPGCTPDYAPFTKIIQPEKIPTVQGRSTSKLRETLLHWREVALETPTVAPVVQLVGNAAILKWFERGALELGDTLVIFNLGALLEGYDATSLRDYCLAATRVAILHEAVLLVIGRIGLSRSWREYFDEVLLFELVQRAPRLALYGETPWLLPTPRSVWLVERGRVGPASRAAIWQDRAQACGTTLSEVDAQVIASRVQFHEPEIDATIRLCGEHVTEIKLLQAAARHIAQTSTPSTVRRLETVFHWDDIVLPDAILTQLRQVPGHVRHAGQVLEEWGYESRMPYGQGIAALFTGVSGTGKTMAAQIIAEELGVEIFQVDLAKTVSKYIGETEKNLDAVFEAAEKASAVLLFDEADALFGKRTEVRDAHDRYANVEVAYLLQRMESYSGLAILTSNFRQNIDKAFVRRLRFVIDFPAPSAQEREAIWQRVFPPNAPLTEDVSFSFLARRLEITGGNIQQIAISAAFAAAAEGGSIAMSHIVQATCRELRKLGMDDSEQWLTTLAQPERRVKMQ